ncbi:MAG TPA: hypothetical protein VMU68_10320 [Acidimicrobiales bacterium]|nr:hypothetical protein [Acidimicrobiales bacterium]
MDVQELLGKVAQHLSVSRAFGTPYEKGGSLVIPVAFVAGGGGGGEGPVGPVTPDSHDVADSDVDNSTMNVQSTGSGGGFGEVVMPAGVYVVKDEQVRWVPAVNANLVIVVAFLSIRMIARARRRARRHARNT